MQDVIEATAWIERSMPPVMITKVAPAAIRNSVMVSAVTAKRLPADKNRLSIAPTSKIKTMRQAKGRWSFSFSNIA